MTDTITYGPVFGIFLIVVTITFVYLLFTWTTQTQAHNGAFDRQAERLQTAIDVKSTSILNVFRCESKVEATLDNTGETSILDFSQMDVFQRYTSATGNQVSKRLTYGTGNLPKDEWTFPSITPATTNPGMWDPGEIANLTSRLSQPPKPGTLGYITVVTPNGFSDSKYVDFTNAVSADCRFLHNHPTPPTGDTPSHAVLPLDPELPTAQSLFNYDTNRDNDPG